MIDQQKINNIFANKLNGGNLELTIFLLCTIKGSRVGLVDSIVSIARNPYVSIKW